MSPPARLDLAVCVCVCIRECTIVYLHCLKMTQSAIIRSVCLFCQWLSPRSLRRSVRAHLLPIIDWARGSESDQGVGRSPHIVYPLHWFLYFTQSFQLRGYCLAFPWSREEKGGAKRGSRRITEFAVAAAAAVMPCQIVHLYVYVCACFSTSLGEIVLLSETTQQ